MGYHFPESIVERACTSLGIDLDVEDDVLRRHEEWPEERPRHVRRTNYQHSKRSKKQGVRRGAEILEMSQVELDVEAKAAILDMFPAIPEATMLDIIDHAFEKVRPFP